MMLQKKRSGGAISVFRWNISLYVSLVKISVSMYKIDFYISYRKENIIVVYNPDLCCGIEPSTFPQYKS